MATDLNRVLLIGRLTQKPVLQTTQTGSVFTRISLANNRSYYTKDRQLKEEVGFYNCVSWGKQAEVICRYLDKGRRIAVDGSLRFSSWEGADGKKQSRVEIQIDNFQFLDPKGADSVSTESISPVNQTQKSNTVPPQSYSTPSMDNLQNLPVDVPMGVDAEQNDSITDDDIPF